MPTVTGFFGIVARFENDDFTWYNPAPRQTPVIVTYSFSSGAKLDRFGEGYPSSASYHKFTSAQQANFRDAADKFSAVAGITFVEVKGTAMINVARGQDTGVGGFASYPISNQWYTNPYFGEFVIDGTGSFSEGSYEFLAMMHELGHAVGLSHPHEGPYYLRDDVDNLDNTVMTYNNDTGSSRFPSKLGSLDKKALKYLYGDPENTTGWTFKQEDGAFHVSGSARRDTIMGIDDENVLRGKDGRDKLIGREYDDELYGGNGGDVLYGYNGDDTLRGHGSNDKISGGVGNDRVFGGSGEDVLYGGVSEDRLYGGSYSDTLYGGSGEDQLAGGTRADLLIGGTSSDTLDGETGHDRLYGNTSADLLRGGDGDDRLYGGRGNDDLLGQSGDDTLYGGQDHDYLVGSTGKDRMFGGSGRDELFGGKGDDRLYGGTYSDTLHGGQGLNTLTGDTGGDTFLFTKSGSATVASRITDFGDGDDVIDIRAFNTDFASLAISNSSWGAKISLTATDTIYLQNYTRDMVQDSFFDFG